MATSIFKADRVGNLTNLATDAKTNLVAAINEVDSHTDTANSKADIVQAQVSNSGDAYDSTKAYAVGDLCIHNNTLYRCTTACSAGSWATNQSCFTADTLTNAINSANENLSAYSRDNTGFNGNLGSGSLSSIKCGKTVTITFAVNNTVLNVNESAILAFVPNGYRPSTTVTCIQSAWIFGSTATRPSYGAGNFTLDTSGNITQHLSNNVPTGSTLKAVFEFTVDD